MWLGSVSERSCSRVQPPERTRRVWKPHCRPNTMSWAIISPTISTRSGWSMFNFSTSTLPSSHPGLPTVMGFLPLASNRMLVNAPGPMMFIPLPSGRKRSVAPSMNRHSGFRRYNWARSNFVELMLKSTSMTTAFTGCWSNIFFARLWKLSSIISFGWKEWHGYSTFGDEIGFTCCYLPLKISLLDPTLSY